MWRPLPNGEIAAEFVKLPLWHFENKTGALRFLPTSTSSDGVPMPEGEWLVTTGDGVGIPAAICAMAKRMSFQDWLLFSERSGMPIIVGKTGAAFKSDQWNNIKAAIRSIYRDTRVLLDNASSIEAIDTGHAANIPFPPLVEWADRAIAALYRGADLSTISKGDGTGASLQGDESGMIEQDAAENLGEVLHEQVDRFVIRYVTGDDEPLAKIVIEPVTKPDVDTDIKIDNHLVSMGCRLSKSDMLARYGRTEATSDDDVAEQKQQTQPGLGVLGQPALPNEKVSPAPAGQIQAAGQQSQGQDADKVSRKLLESFARDTGPAADAIKELLNAIESGADAKAEAASLVSRLPSLMPDDPAMAAVIAEAMAKEFGTVELENEVQRVPGGNGNGGQFTGKTNQPRGKEPETKPQHDRYGSTDEKTLAAEPQKNFKRGANALEAMKRMQGGYIDKAMYREETGWIRFDWGDTGDPAKEYAHGHGISHILAKHGKDAKGLPDVIARGDAKIDQKDPRAILLVTDTSYCVIAPLMQSQKRIITMYEPKPNSKKLAEIKNYPPAPKYQGR